ncbi:dual OB domain-containing protein [Leeuwenhoekiella nanhaiensis]|uniref:Dual OB-containing domain-containing protein n=1 Tax=Leeuwenhoekiella nanhaiensis TaxID=1655491 RepID=A0A2G1VS04_9FLAO|nr:hypothetical protein [Leeuwenhoekiella nanhaiensis]PHQ29390.1 hypothetical protein CJ305_10645 [Leeuwenhoekiella nanhaiensis]
MDVIIVSKTHMSNAACVGGILANGRFVRLLNSDGYNQDSDTDLEVGDVFTITFSERTDKRPPHVEDILVYSLEHKFSFPSIEKMVDYLTVKLKVRIWKGSPDILFDGKLNWTNSGSGYINEENGICKNSVGFWISDRDLTKKIFYDKTRYNYPNTNGWRSLPFVGYGNAVENIPAGTLMRVSLARWWDTNGTTEERCSLQLSGWYGLPEPDTKNEEEEDDLPF